ncbi:MAG: hypothetical protein RLZZ618_3666 [Pseudomonadota bacterium]
MVLDPAAEGLDRGQGPERVGRRVEVRAKVACAEADLLALRKLPQVRRLEGQGVALLAPEPLVGLRHRDRAENDLLVSATHVVAGCHRLHNAAAAGGG